MYPYSAKKHFDFGAQYRSGIGPFKEWQKIHTDELYNHCKLVYENLHDLPLIHRMGELILKDFGDKGLRIALFAIHSRFHPVYGPATHMSTYTDILRLSWSTLCRDLDPHNWNNKMFIPSDYSSPHAHPEETIKSPSAETTASQQARNDVLEYIKTFPYKPKHWYDDSFVNDKDYIEAHTDEVYDCSRKVYENLHDTQLVQEMGKRILELGGPTALQLAFFNIYNIHRIGLPNRIFVHMLTLRKSWSELYKDLTGAGWSNSKKYHIKAPKSHGGVSI